MCVEETCAEGAPDFASFERERGRERERGEEKEKRPDKGEKRGEEKRRERVPSQFSNGTGRGREHTGVHTRARTHTHTHTHVWSLSAERTEGEEREKRKGGKRERDGSSVFPLVPFFLASARYVYAPGRSPGACCTAALPPSLSLSPLAVLPF